MLDSLGGPCPVELHTCDRFGCAPSACSRPPMRWTGDHTGIVCPECGPCCWDVPPEAVQRAADHAAGLRALAARTRQASAALPRAELDALDRAEHRTAWQLRRIAVKVLEDPRITDETRADYEWFARELGKPLPAGRADELAEQMAACPVQRRGRLRRVVTLDPADYEDVEDQADEDEDAPGSGPAQPWRVNAAPELPALGSGAAQPWRVIAAPELPSLGSGAYISMGDYTPCDRCRRIGRHGADGRWLAAWYETDPAGVPELADLGSANLCPPCWSELRPLPRIIYRSYPPCPPRADLAAYAEWQRSRAIADMELARSRDTARSLR